MNTQSNAAPGAFASQAAEPRAISTVQTFYWCVRRELWENRSLYIAPLAAAGVFFLGLLIGLFHFANKMRTADPLLVHEYLEQPYTLAALLIMGATLIVGWIYCLDALYGERRDRSILFWKSLPVSDVITVLSKATIPIVVLPLITFAVTIGLWIVVYLVNSAVLLGIGVTLPNAGSHLSFFQMSMALLLHLVGLHGFWWAPIWAWLLLVSAWARRAPLLWATLPLFAIGIVEKLAFNTSHFAAMLGFRFSGEHGQMSSSQVDISMAMLNHQTFGQFLLNPHLWIGLAVAAAFLAAAVRLRRSREPI